MLAGSASELLVVLPFNVTAKLPDRLESSSPVAWKELTTYLKAHAIPIKTLAFPTARRLWLECVREARAAKPGTRSGFDEAAVIFVARLSQHVEFDTLVIPTLFVQGAPISGRTASWDRAEHPIEFDEGEWQGRIPEDTSFGGALPAVTLHAVVLDAEGKEVQQAQAGLALLVTVRMRGRPEGAREPSYQLVDRPNPFENREQVLEGIALAFAPLLPRLDPAAVAKASP